MKPKAQRALAGLQPPLVALSLDDTHAATYVVLLRPQDTPPEWLVKMYDQHLLHDCTLTRPTAMTAKVYVTIYTKSHYVKKVVCPYCEASLPKHHDWRDTFVKFHPSPLTTRQ